MHIHAHVDVFEIFIIYSLPIMAKDEETVELKISEIDLFVINKVRELRITRNISQLNLSILMGLAEGTIGKIENPRQRAKYNIRHLNLLAKALKCSPREFIPEKPLSNDIIKVKIRFSKRTKAAGEASFEIIEKTKVD